MSLASLLVDAAAPLTFRSHDVVRGTMKAVCERNADVASFEQLGTSEDGRPIDGVVLGRGPKTISLIAGNHSDEPVGPESLRLLVIQGLERRRKIEHLLERFRFVIVPHTNPDGEIRNRPWIEKWPDVETYIRHAFREPPGRDLEFGYPDLRVENEIVSDFLSQNGPFELHASLHGMGFGEGAMLLIERRWTFRTERLQDVFLAAAREAGLDMHDHNRKGEKGFFYIEAGFSTTPEGEAMRTFFRAKGDQATAKCFRDSSMEFVRKLGGDPLCLVTELPLFVIDRREKAPVGVPAAYLSLRERLPELRQRLEEGRSIREELEPFGLRHLDLDAAVRVQLKTLDCALEQVG